MKMRAAHLSSVLLAYLTLLTGCATARLKVLTQQPPPPTPYARVLVIYIDNYINFTRLDPAAYDSIRPGLIDPNAMEMRSSSEKKLVSHLSGKRSVIIPSSGISGSAFNNYSDLRATLSSQSIDAILFIHRIRNSGHFGCSLIDDRTGQTVWTGRDYEQGVSGVPGKIVLKSYMIDLFRDGLVKGGYIAPHGK